MVAGASWGLTMKEKLVGAGRVQTRLQIESLVFVQREEWGEKEGQQPTGRTGLDNGP